MAEGASCVLSLLICSTAITTNIRSYKNHHPRSPLVPLRYPPLPLTAHYIPPQQQKIWNLRKTTRRPAPNGPEGLSPRPPASRRANWPIPQGTISLAPTGAAWIGRAYHPKPRRQIDREGATPTKEGATLPGKTEPPGRMPPPTTGLRESPWPPANWRSGIQNRKPPGRQTPPFSAARMPQWLLNQLASGLTAQTRAQGPSSGFPPPSARRCRIS